MAAANVLEDTDGAPLEIRRPAVPQAPYIIAREQLSAHQGEMAFLRHLMFYADNGGCHELEGKLLRAEKKERCARRAMWLMAILMFVAVAGLGYSAVLLPEIPRDVTRFPILAFCALGLASLVSLLVFGALWLIARGSLDDHRDECRLFVARMVELRLGKAGVL